MVLFYHDMDSAPENISLIFYTNVFLVVSMLNNA